MQRGRGQSVSRREVLEYARGLYHPARVSAEGRQGRYCVIVGGQELHSGPSWGHVYADMRRKLVRRETQALMAAEAKAASA